MAPIETDGSEFGEQTLDTDTTVTIVSALMIGVSMMVAVIICGCGGKKEEQAPGMACGGGGTGAASVYYSTDPNAIDYCPECAAAAAAGEQPTEIAPESQMGASKGAEPTVHRYVHKGGGGGSGSGEATSGITPAGTLAPTVQSAVTHKIQANATNYQGAAGGASKMPAGGMSKMSERFKRGGKGVMLPSDTQISKAAANPAVGSVRSGRKETEGDANDAAIGREIGFESSLLDLIRSAVGHFR